MLLFGAADTRIVTAVSHISAIAIHRFKDNPSTHSSFKPFQFAVLNPDPCSIVRESAPEAFQGSSSVKGRDNCANFSR
jgi:hypothetical protein